MQESRRKFVVVDTAPTGHTLLVIDATGAYHRAIVRHTSPDVRVVTPMMRLQDPSQTKMVIVTLPETTPVLEAEALQADLRRAGIRVPPSTRRMTRLARRAARGSWVTITMVRPSALNTSGKPITWAGRRAVDEHLVRLHALATRRDERVQVHDERDATEASSDGLTIIVVRGL